MKLKVAFILVVTLFLFSVSPAQSWIQPFIMGQGRYLNQKEMNAFFHEIDNQPETIKKSISETLGNLIIPLFEYHYNDNAKFQIIEFTKFEIAVGGMEKSKGQGPYYLLCINCNEGIPDAEQVKRKKTKNKYYDIWITSGPNILIERDNKSKAFRILNSGFAE